MAEVVKGFTQPVRLEYRYTPGLAMSRFLRQIEQGRIVGQRCPSCSRVYVPPRSGACPRCGVPTGEEVKAVVQPREGAEPGPELEGELIAFAKQKVAGYKVPRSVDFVDELPRDPNGKLYKRKLRDPYWEGRTRAI